MCQCHLTILLHTVYIVIVHSSLCLMFPQFLFLSPLHFSSFYIYHVLNISTFLPQHPSWDYRAVYKLHLSGVHMVQVLIWQSIHVHYHFMSLSTTLDSNTNSNLLEIFYYMTTAWRGNFVVFILVLLIVILTSCSCILYYLAQNTRKMPKMTENIVCWFISVSSHFMGINSTL